MLVGIIVAFGVGGIVYAIRRALWGDRVPKTIHSLRWVIGFAIGIPLIILEAVAGLRLEALGPINAFVIFVVAQELKNAPVDLG